MFFDKIKSVFKKKDKTPVSEITESALSTEFAFDSDGADSADGADEDSTIQTEISAETNAVAIIDSDGKDKNHRGKERGKALDDFSRLAEILNKDERDVIEECKLFQIRNIMSKLSKAVVRRGMPDGRIKALIKNVGVSGIYEIAVAPAYIGAFAANIKDQNLKVCAVVDFPFGEASFKVKFAEIKNCVKSGVDGVLTVINTAVLSKQHQAELKKQLIKAGRIKGVETGVAVNAEDISADEIKRFFRVLEKTDTDYAAFLFGKVSKRELSLKMAEINANKGGVKVKVMANVEDVSGVKALIALGADGIITPYADAVAKELFKDLGIKSVRLT